MSLQFLERNKNKKLLYDGLLLMQQIPYESVSCAIVDFQYRAGLDKLKYGNEGKSRMMGRGSLTQMSDDLIVDFITGLMDALKESAYLFLWVDKFTVAENIHGKWINNMDENPPILVDMIVWDKSAFGMGARSRRTNEFLLVYQKEPKTTKNWTDKGIPDTWRESIPNPRNKDLHPHRKPIELTKRLINATTKEGDFVIDPCAGSFTVLDGCAATNRNFIGCDIDSRFGKELPYEEL